jgi:hypothetical protein
VHGHAIDDARRTLGLEDEPEVDDLPGVAPVDGPVLVVDVPAGGGEPLGRARDDARAERGVATA